MEKELRDLAWRYGIQTEYQDFFGRIQHARRETVQAVLHAMGADARDAHSCGQAIVEFDRRRLSRGIAPTLFYPEYASFYETVFSLRADTPSRQIGWHIVEEHGAKHDGSARIDELPVVGEEWVGGEHWKHYKLKLNVRLPIGYHSLYLEQGSDTSTIRSSMLIVYPNHCFLPPDFERGRRMWGIQAQVYNLRSNRNWGIGDFGDLKDLAALTAELGGGVVGLSPLHALALRDYEQVSPYSPSSRAALNTLFLDVTAIEEFATCRAARESVASTQDARTLAALQESSKVDYKRVTELKLSVLEMLYTEFCSHHLAQDSVRAKDFVQFIAGHPEVEQYAVYEALAEYCAKVGGGRRPWQEWPKGLQNPANAEVQEFRADRASRVGFYAYLQWQVDAQLKDLRDHTQRSGLPIGLYLDLALSARRDGAESWANQKDLVFDVSLGAPPDMYNRDGQDWLAAPYSPHGLQDSHFASFRTALRTVMRHAGAVRIDHVMSFMRLFWIPKNVPPRDGLYVRYPLQDYMSIVALESQRHKCVVIGEDLGTVANEVRQAMTDRRLLSYRVFLFFKKGEADYEPSWAYPRNSLVVASVHDSPTLRGFWTCNDIFARKEIGMIHENELGPNIKHRERERWGILQALWREKFYVPNDAVRGEYSRELSMAVHCLLARSPAMLQMVTLEDLAEQMEQLNIPGTLHEYPNWCPKLAQKLQELRMSPFVWHIARAIKDQGRS